MKKSQFNDYSASQISLTIDEWVHNSKYREILKSSIIDGKTYRSIADEYYMSEQGVVKIIDNCGNVLLDKLKKGG